MTKYLIYGSALKLCDPLVTRFSRDGVLDVYDVLLHYWRLKDHKLEEATPRLQVCHARWRRGCIRAVCNSLTSPTTLPCAGARQPVQRQAWGERRH